MPNGFSSEEEDEEYIQARISYVGFADQLGLEGVVILKTIDGKEFPMRAFSGEVASISLVFKRVIKIPYLQSII